MLPPSPYGYRPDIDGLRALAVLPVLLYHAGVPGFTGGYIGVDIFFVISGFLITGIIVREIDAGDFSIMRFYERRARRILPALLAVIGFVLIGASLLFLPSDFAGVAPSALAAIGFLSNVWLFTEVGYFQAPAKTTPLLHTWSLGVEEQFYIALPIALVLIARFAKTWRVPALIAAMLISFAWAIAKQADTDGFAFYMLPTRAWELLLGSLLALGLIPAVKQRWLAELVCVLAVAAIAVATALYDEATVFPGVAALVPVVAATALIHCAPGTWTGMALSLKGPVWIGLISYSLYLWHWPLIVFWSYSQNDPLSGWQSIVAVAASIAIAWLSWRFIEQPFRSKSRFGPRRVWQWTGAGIGMASAVCLGLLAVGGWSSRFDERTLRYASAASDFSPARVNCASNRVKDHPDSCTLGAQAVPTAMIWGDSHAIELAWVLGEQYGARGEAIAQRTRGSCPPAIGYSAARDPDCAVFNGNILAEIAAKTELETVYLSAFWISDNYREAQVDQQVDTTIEQLRRLGKRVVLIGPIPAQPASVPRELALAGDAARTRSASEFDQQVQWFTRNFPDWRAEGVTIIEPRDHLVVDGQTMIVADNAPLYYDSHHLSLAGARLILAP